MKDGVCRCKSVPNERRRRRTRESRRGNGRCDVAAGADSFPQTFRRISLLNMKKGSGGCCGNKGHSRTCCHRQRNNHPCIRLDHTPFPFNNPRSCLILYFVSRTFFNPVWICFKASVTDVRRGRASQFYHGHPIPRRFQVLIRTYSTI